MEKLAEWALGHLSPTARIWTALAPALLLCAYFLGGLLVYLIRSRLRGVERDAGLEGRPATALLGLWLRFYFAWLMRPLWRLLLRSGIPANAVTTLSVLLAAAAGVALAAGRFALGGWLYISAGVCDFFDGRLARQRGEVGASGGVLDSVLDRYSDAAVLAGLAWYYRDSWVLLAVLLAMVGASLIPYVRAKGEAAGVTMNNVGLMQRAERIVCLGATTALSPVVEAMVAPQDPRPLHRLAVAGIVLLAVSTQLTAARRLLHVLSALRGSTPAPALSSGARLRRLASSSLAVLAEVLVLLALVRLAGSGPALAAGLALLFGGGLRAVVHRSGTYGRLVPGPHQEARFAGVTLSSALLVALVLSVLLLLPGMDFRLGWLLARLAVLLAWTRPLHREYVAAGAPPQLRLSPDS